MARPRAKDLTERELEVMHIFWSMEEMTAAEARDRLAMTGLDRSYPTIANLVRALEEKGFLAQVNDERPFVYRAARTYEEVSGRMLGDLLNRVFLGSQTDLLYRLIEQRKLSRDERKTLQRILEDHER